jgi:hypothetical protein
MVRDCCDTELPQAAVWVVVPLVLEEELDWPPPVLAV